MSDNHPDNRDDPDKVNRSNLPRLIGFTGRHYFFYISVEGESKEKLDLKIWKVCVKLGKLI